MNIKKNIAVTILTASLQIVPNFEKNYKKK